MTFRAPFCLCTLCPPRKEPAMTTLTPEAEALGGDGSRPAGDTAATDATPPAASTSPPLADKQPDLAPVDVPAPPDPPAAFLATSNETAAPVGPSGDVPSKGADQ